LSAHENKFAILGRKITFYDKKNIIKSNFLKFICTFALIKTLLLWQQQQFNLSIEKTTITGLDNKTFDI